MKEITEAKSLDRKHDTRNKIELGGLVVKAGLRNADRAFILGALLEAAEYREGSPDHARLTKRGREIFSK